MAHSPLSLWTTLEAKIIQCDSATNGTKLIDKILAMSAAEVETAISASKREYMALLSCLMRAVPKFSELMEELSLLPDEAGRHRWTHGGMYVLYTGILEMTSRWKDLTGSFKALKASLYNLLSCPDGEDRDRDSGREVASNLNEFIKCVVMQTQVTRGVELVMKNVIGAAAA